MIDQRGVDRDFPLLYEMAQQYDFAERLGGSDSPILEEADRALREIWMARGERCPINPFGSTVHEFPSHELGTKCRCGQMMWEGGLVDA